MYQLLQVSTEDLQTNGFIFNFTMMAMKNESSINVSNGECIYYNTVYEHSQMPTQVPQPVLLVSVLRKYSVISQ